MPDCLVCNTYFPTWVKIDGKNVSLSGRKYCLNCSPRGLRNRKVLAGPDGRKKRQGLGEAEPLQPSWLLAYFLGVFAGDGSLTRMPRTYMLRIACDTRHDYLIAQFIELVQNLVGLTLKPQQDGENGTKLSGCLVDLPILLQLPSGKKGSNGFRLPEWIFTRTEYCKAFVKGLIETDGGVYRIFHNGGWSWRCQFTNTNEHIKISFLRASELCGYSFKRTGNPNVLSMTGKDDVQAIMNELNLSQKLLTYIYSKPKVVKVKESKPVKIPKIRNSKKPPREVLEKIVWEIPTTKIAERYGVSDKAVEKWCKSYGIAKPPRGYWAKVAGV